LSHHDNASLQVLRKNGFLENQTFTVVRVNLWSCGNVETFDLAISLQKISKLSPEFLGKGVCYFIWGVGFY